MLIKAMQLLQLKDKPSVALDDTLESSFVGEEI